MFSDDDPMENRNNYGPFKSLAQKQLNFNRIEHPFDQEAYDPRNFSLKKKMWKMRTQDDLRDQFNVKKLLPQEVEDDWFDIIPHESTQRIQGTELLDPSIAIGVSTSMGTRRNNNGSDIRGQPAVPKMAVSPWNNSSILPSTNFYGLDRQCPSDSPAEDDFINFNNGNPTNY